MKTLALALLLAAGSVHAGEFTALVGAAQVGKSDDGTYYNKNQKHEINLLTAPVGVRWDSDKWRGVTFAVQGLYYGQTNIDAMAVTMDAPHPGGYDPKTGACVGPCKPLARWVMTTETSSLTFFVTKSFGRWFVGPGLNLYESRTSGYVQFQDGSIWRYPSSRFMDTSLALEVGYRVGAVSVRFQATAMEGKGQTPSVATGNTYSLLAGYTF